MMDAVRTHPVHSLGGRFIMTVFRVLVVVALVTTPCQAQTVRASDSGVSALEVFFRVGARIGQEQSVFARSWPQEFTDGGVRSSLRLSAADRLVVHAEAGADPADKVVRVVGVRLWRTLPDTAVLKAVLTETERELTQRFGPATECSDPLGPPSHLYMPQQVSRFWTRGVGGQPTRLTWTVSTERLADVELYAGQSARSDDLTLRCNAQMP
jgi:hypothetical protein